MNPGMSETKWIVVETTRDPKDVADALARGNVPHGLVVLIGELQHATLRCAGGCPSAEAVIIGAWDGPNEIYARAGRCTRCGAVMGGDPNGVEMPFAVDWNALPRTASRARWQR